MSSSITVETMRPRLHTLDHVYRVLQRSEPLDVWRFSVGDTAVRFRAEPGWHHGANAKDANEPVGVYVSRLEGLTSAPEYQLTRSALEEACHTFGFKRDFTIACPAELLVPHLNYWFREGLLERPKRHRDFQFMINGATAVAFTQQSLTPLSNLALLDNAVAAVHQRLGADTEILADYKFSHTMRKTYLRLILPQTGRLIIGTDTPDDQWSRGISIKNSLIGASQTAIESYLFRWVCTNGQIDSRAGSGTWSRRKDTTDAEVYDWARQAVDEALTGFDSAFDAVQRLTDISIDGNLADAIRDVFEHYKIPIHQRPKIIRILEEHDGEITMYVIMNAITQVANEHGLEPATVDSLMRHGGDLPYTAEQRCGACHRMMHAQ